MLQGLVRLVPLGEGRTRDHDDDEDEDQPDRVDPDLTDHSLTGRVRRHIGVVRAGGAALGLRATVVTAVATLVKPAAAVVVEGLRVLDLVGRVVPVAEREGDGHHGQAEDDENGHHDPRGVPHVVAHVLPFGRFVYLTVLH